MIGKYFTQPWFLNIFFFFRFWYPVATGDSDAEVLSEDEWLEKFPIRNNEDSDLEEEEEEEMFPAELSSSTEGQEESLTQSHYQKYVTQQ